MKFKHDNPNSSHVLATTIKEAIENCMFGYTPNNATPIREDTKYYAYLQRGSDPAPRYGMFTAGGDFGVGHDGNIRNTTIDGSIGSEFKFLTEQFNYPVQFLKLPAGYDRIVLNVYFRDLDQNNDFIFTMIPVIKESIPLKNTEVIVHLHINKNHSNGEQVHFWQVKDWVNSSEAGEYLFDNITDFIELTSSNIDAGSIKTLRAIACPYENVIRGYDTNNVPVLGWFEAN